MFYLVISTTGELDSVLKLIAKNLFIDEKEVDINNIKEDLEYDYEKPFKLILHEDVIFNGDSSIREVSYINNPNADPYEKPKVGESFVYDLCSKVYTFKNYEKIYIGEIMFDHFKETEYGIVVLSSKKSSKTIYKNDMLNIIKKCDELTLEGRLEDYKFKVGYGDR